MRWPWSRVAAAAEPEPEPEDKGPDLIYAYDLYLCCYARIMQGAATHVAAENPSEQVAAFAIAAQDAKKGHPLMSRGRFLQELRGLVGEDPKPPAAGAAPPEAPAPAPA